jgi:UDP-glucose 4-epimerase
MNILVTGGAGYIGSVVVEETLRAGHKTVVYDNLVKGHREMVAEDAVFVEGDLVDREKLVRVFREHDIAAVIHMAAYSLVGESVSEPAKYYQNNVVAGLTLLDAMRDCNVKKIVFSSTAATYGEPEKQPIEESDRTAPTNPYGDSKLAFEHALKAYDRAYGIKYVSLRYFNAAGASERCGEIHDPETHLIPIVLQVAAGQRDLVEIYGDDYPTRDGTCVRDYIHVIDLARAHVKALEILDERSAIFNLGCGGDGYTVKEVVDCARDVTGREIAVRTAPRRPGDPAVLIASSDRIRKELGWQPEYQDLRVIIETAWKWMRSRENGESSAKDA